MEEQFENEVRAFHRYLADWFTGAMPRTPDDYANLTETLADGFVLISPRGELMERENMAGALESAHGAFADKGFRVEIENCRVRHRAGDQILGTYEARQSVGDDEEIRLCTAVFRGNDAARNGLDWLHLHETWLKGHAPKN